MLHLAADRSVLPAIALHWKALNTWLCEPYHIRVKSNEYDQICTDKRFDLEDQNFCR